MNYRLEKALVEIVTEEKEGIIRQALIERAYREEKESLAQDKATADLILSSLNSAINSNAYKLACAMLDDFKEDIKKTEPEVILKECGIQLYRLLNH